MPFTIQECEAAMKSTRLFHAVLIALFAITLNQVALAESGSFSKTLTVSDAPTVFLTTGSGGIQLDGAEGKVSAHTGSGHIKLQNVNGGLDASTGSGGIEAEGTAKTDWDLHTGSGGIHVRMPSQAGYKVDAHSGSGS